MALRQTTGFVESLLRLIGLNWSAPNFSTLSRRQKTLKVNIPDRGSQGPLQLLIDTTGIKVEGEGEWTEEGQQNSPGNCLPDDGASTVVPSDGFGARSTVGSTRVRRIRKRSGGPFPRRTPEIRAAEFTTSDAGDAPMLPELLDQIPPDQEIATVTADGAFDTRKCHDAIATRGAAAFGHSLGPVAFVPSLPPRKNARPWKSDTPGALGMILEPVADNASPRTEALSASKRFGRTIWRRW
jgi:hypothetical protein